MVDFGDLARSEPLIPCKFCTKGRVETEPGVFKDCRYCGGEGEGPPCQECGGTGRLPDRYCGFCENSGIAVDVSDGGEMVAILLETDTTEELLDAITACREPWGSDTFAAINHGIGEYFISLSPAALDELEDELIAVTDDPALIEIDA